MQVDASAIGVVMAAVVNLVLLAAGYGSLRYQVMETRKKVDERDTVINTLVAQVNELVLKVRPVYEIFMGNAMRAQAQAGLVFRTSPVLPTPSLLMVLHRTSDPVCRQTIRELAHSTQDNPTETEIAQRLALHLGLPYIVRRAEHFDIGLDTYLVWCVAIYNWFRANPDAVDLETLPTA